MARAIGQPPPGVVLSPLLTVRGREGAHRYIRDVLGLPLRFNYVRDCIARGEIHYTKIAGVHMFSTADLFTWASGLAQYYNSTGT
jgi:hypothetical protein